jgi:hypothetical protein
VACEETAATGRGGLAAVSEILIPRCTTCRQKLLCAEGQSVEPIGGARIIRSEPDLVVVVCVCGEVREWERRKTTANLVR